MIRNWRLPKLSKLSQKLLIFNFFIYESEEKKKCTWPLEILHIEFNASSLFPRSDRILTSCNCERGLNAKKNKGFRSWPPKLALGNTNEKQCVPNCSGLFIPVFKKIISTSIYKDSSPSLPILLNSGMICRAKLTKSHFCAKFKNRLPWSIVFWQIF